MPPLVAGALVFFTSGAVLVLEILAARLLAPYVGVTLETYTGIIGTVLAGIAAGTWAGGWLADRVPPRRMLGPLLTVGGALSIATIPLVRAVGVAGGGGPDQVLVLSFVGFFAPAAVLSAVTPTVIKLQLRDLAVTGQVVGRLSALGTVGAIAGTFLAGFVLVEAAATTTSITVVGGVLVAAGLLTWVWLRDGRPLGAGVALVLLLPAITLADAVGDPCHAETTYHCARIEHDTGRDTGRRLVLDTLSHSYVDLADPTHLEFRYTQVFADVVDAVAPAGRPLEALHLGGGGFTMPRWLAATRPGSDSLVLEIDTRLVTLAEEHLGLVTGPDLRVRTGDARTELQGVEDRSRDIVLGDAFGGLAVPWHLTTAEFAGEVQRVLRPGGVYVLNVIDHPPLRFARAELATLDAVFDHVAVVAPAGILDGSTGGNVVLVAGDRPLPLDVLAANIARRDGLERVAGGAGDFAAGAPVLTDDRAPVDQWLARSRRGRAGT